MDPNAAWSNLTNAIEAERWVEAAEIADELLCWIVKGGFPPEITGRHPIDRLITRSLCESVAAWDGVC